MKISHNLVAKAWQRAGLQPHRFERYMQSDDPDFETKAADVIGLYVNPPDHAAVFAVDEKTAIQALDRLDPVLPLSPGRAERHGFEYYRHGTLSLLAALDTQSGEVLGQTVPRHTSAAFVEFLGDIVATQPKRREIHVIADNLSTHKTQAVRTFLVAHPHVHLHFTPTYSSWLNQVELWFAKIERDLLARGIFTSVADLARKIRRYIRHYNKAPKPIRWNYRNPAHRISRYFSEYGPLAVWQLEDDGQAVLRLSHPVSVDSVAFKPDRGICGDGQSRGNCTNMAGGRQ